MDHPCRRGMEGRRAAAPAPEHDKIIGKQIFLMRITDYVVDVVVVVFFF